jgi:hypothetical protein
MALQLDGKSALDAVSCALAQFAASVVGSVPFKMNGDTFVASMNAMAALWEFSRKESRR